SRQGIGVQSHGFRTRPFFGFCPGSRFGGFGIAARGELNPREPHQRRASVGRASRLARCLEVLFRCFVVARLERTEPRLQRRRGAVAMDTSRQKRDGECDGGPDLGGREHGRSASLMGALFDYKGSSAATEGVSTRSFMTSTPHMPLFL